MTLYQTVVQLGLEHDHHETDLYLKVTPEATRLVEEFGPDKFLSEGKLWYDIPFAYDPEWERKMR